MKFNYYLGIGLLIAGIALVIQRFINIHDVVYILLMLVALVLEVIGLIKMRKQ